MYVVYYVEPLGPIGLAMVYYICTNCAHKMSTVYDATEDDPSPEFELTIKATEGVDKCLKAQHLKINWEN
jgi:hypothetical protein